jgi:AMP nucleosidase
MFDVPDLNATDDQIANGTYEPMRRRADAAGAVHRPAHRLFAAPAVALHRDQPARHFQNFVLFTNYQFYIDEFCAYARELMARAAAAMRAFVEPGNQVTYAGETAPRGRRNAAARLPQMPAYHLTKPGHGGITMVNIGVGPSNAKTITDHVAVLRPHAWLMLGHCAGLRNTPGAWRLCAGARLCARGPRAGRRPAGLGADPGAGRGAGGLAGGGGRNHRLSPATS